MHQVLMKVTSFGKTWQDDYHHLRYIGRGRAALAEGPCGPLDLRNARLAREASRTRSVRLVVTLPRGQEEEGYFAVRQFLAERFDYFVTALHSDEGNPHVHVWLPENPIPTFRDKAALEQELRRYLEAEGIAFRQDLRPDEAFLGRPRERLTPQEKAIREQGKKVWLEQVRERILEALRAATSWGEFQEQLRARGVEVVRVTERNVTLEADGRRVRLQRLFGGYMATRQDVETWMQRYSLRRKVLIAIRQAISGKRGSLERDLLVQGRPGAGVLFRQNKTEAGFPAQILAHVVGKRLTGILMRQMVPQPLGYVLRAISRARRATAQGRFFIPGPTPRPG